MSCNYERLVNKQGNIISPKAEQRSQRNGRHKSNVAINAYTFNTHIAWTSKKGKKTSRNGEHNILLLHTSQYNSPERNSARLHSWSSVPQTQTDIKLNGLKQTTTRIHVKTSTHNTWTGMCSKIERHMYIILIYVNIRLTMVFNFFFFFFTRKTFRYFL